MRKRSESGFTLIELLITLAVIGILAAFAYPAYLDYVTKGKRAEGKAALLQAAQYEERYYTNNNSYTTDLAAAGYKTYSGDTPDKSAYALSVAAGSTGNIATSYLITATPANGFTDPKCGNLTLDQTLTKGKTGSAPLSDCW